MKVSVVVPVFNTGEAIEALIDSLRAQTLPADAWEAVFVDDGSSDDTADLVDSLIAEDANMRLLREKPSGWPGRPRNVGLDAAKGDYVFFSDDDDTLGPEALQRLTAFADANHADVVVPRTVGRNRGVPAITRTVVDAQHEPALIMSSLAPQKLFRREFLRTAGIRFREGHFRLEDHLFVTTAYLRAERVSTYADYPCYTLAYRPGRAHISQQRPDWPAYFASVRACLDRVDEEARDPEVRRAMRSRWLRAEALSRLRGDAYAKLHCPELTHEVRQLLIDRYPPAELAHLKPIDHALAMLAIGGEDDDVAALAAWESSLQVTSEVRSAQVEANGTARIELHSTLTAAASLPVVDDERAVLEQVATFVDVGVELQHVRTKVRRPLAVTHADAVTVAVLAPGEEPLATGRWRVVALAGEHRSRRRRPVQVVGELPLEQTFRRAGTRTLRFSQDDGLILRVRASAPLVPVPLHVRITRRLRRLVPALG
ncbi:glycosyltransferase [uncultured Amnibacterium sp.]|uniref:glycosyltransferase n=1 Tax=uncultured Amnibacterium sp. TaxID=1631851 RepID=UPI0035CC01CC